LDAGVAKAADTPDDAWDAIRRTRLAAERTELAWVRTALTSIAVAVGVGRVVPELSGTTTEWPYLVVGVGWALYSVALFGYGSVRSRKVEPGCQHGGDDPELTGRGPTADGFRDLALPGDRGPDRGVRLTRPSG
jgi:inner membrane protein YidH